MAWTAPRTWVADEIVTAALLNAQLRDNALVLSTHAHTGAAGMGASTLSAVTMTSLATATFADQSGNPSTNGRLQRNGANLLYYDGSSAIDLTASDQSAGTASLRTLGTGSTQAAAGNHTHDVDFSVDGAQSVNTSVTDGWAGGETDTEVIGSIAWTPSGAASRGVFISAAWAFTLTGTTAWVALSANIVIKVGATTLKTITGAAQPGNEGVFYQTSGTGEVTFSAEATATNPLADTAANIIFNRYKFRVAETVGSV